MFDEDERFVTSDFISEDAEIEVGLRPRNLSEYIGQEKAKNNLEIYIKAALERREALDHVLLYGPPGDWVKPYWQVLLPMRWVLI